MCCAPMRVQVRALREASSTDVTCEGTFTGVCPHVVTDLGAARECLPADAAHVRLSVGVDHAVHFQVVLGSERFTTNVTYKILYTRVCLFVLIQILRRKE